MTLPPALGQTETDGSLESLTRLQTDLRDQQETALIQVWVEETRRIMFVYARGVLAGSYAVEEGASRPILQADIPSYWNGRNAAIQRVPVSDQVGRLAWLALESSLERRSELCNQAEWERQAAAWKDAKFSGVVELASRNEAGYLVWAGGKMLADESAWTGDQTLASLLQDAPVSLSVSAPVPEANAWECLSLRQSGMKWANGILSRFQHVAGTKFAQTVAREIAQLIRPWQWRIRVEKGQMRDEHFFPRAAAATHAYRAIFMGMGAQMGFVIGNMLTQRILSEMYYELDGDERAVLALNRLIPAAFSE
ncbi:MAG: hypothetical protein AB1750_16185 [Chloroflexota bacterium]